MKPERVAPFLVVGVFAVLYAVALAVIGLGVLAVTVVDTVIRPLRDPRYASVERGRDA